MFKPGKQDDPTKSIGRFQDVFDIRPRACNIACKIWASFSETCRAPKKSRSRALSPELLVSLGYEGGGAIWGVLLSLMCMPLFCFSSPVSFPLASFVPL